MTAGVADLRLGGEVEEENDGNPDSPNTQLGNWVKENPGGNAVGVLSLASKRSTMLFKSSDSQTLLNGDINLMAADGGIESLADLENAELVTATVTQPY
jgi:hypothetical protein